MKQGDIYIVAMDPTKGREQRGHRPVVIVSATAFNNATNLPIVCPITNGGKFASKIGFAVSLVNITTTGIVRCDQPRVLDLNVRQGRYVETLPKALLAQVLAKVRPIFT